jgi:hypothetical protein
MEKAPGGGIRLSHIAAFLQNGMGRKTGGRLSNE